MSAIEGRALAFRYAADRMARLTRIARTPRTAPTARVAEMAPIAPPDLPAHGIEAVDLACEAGEIVVLLGPNGAGKSTLLRLLGAGVRPSGGTLRLLGEPAWPPTPALRRRIGFAGDLPVHFDPLPAAENALFFARAAGLPLPAARAATAALLARLGLAGDAARPAGELSHGMRRKLLLVEALAHEPPLVFLDEPTLGLDPPSREALADLLRERAAAGASIVLATHDTALAGALCHRVLFLHRGRKVLEGEPADLIRRTAPQTRLEVALRSGAVPPDLRFDDGAILSTGPDRIVFASRRGSAALPALCASLLDAGAEIRAIQVREPDLGDVFHAATGAPLEAGRDAP